MLALALALLAAADPAPATTGVLTRAPELQHFVEADYPPDELAAHREATVTLDVDIDERGAVTQVQIVESAGAAFDHAAIEAVSQFEFTAAEIDGKAAPVRITYKYAFTIREEKVAAPAPEGAVNFRGKLVERGTRKPLQATEISAASETVTRTAESDSEGQFEMKGLPPGKYKIRVAGAQHERFDTDEEIREGEVTEATYFIRRRSYTAFETTVRGEREKKEVARKSLTLEEIKKVPGTSGDAVAVIQTLPGTSRIPYGLGFLVVRGTRPDDTKSYLDGIWIPIIFHFGGFPVSVVNADALTGIDFYSGNFSARYGNALGGSVEARTRSPSTDPLHGYADVSVIDAKALVEGKTSENGSFIAAARRSYVEGVLKAIDFTGVSPSYADYYLRHDWKLSGAKAAVYAYGAYDALTAHLQSTFSANPEEREGLTTAIQFHRLQGLYEKTLGPTVTNRTVAALGIDDRGVSFGSTIHGGGRWIALQARDDVTWTPSPSFELTLGAEARPGQLTYSVDAPNSLGLTQIPDPILARELVHDSDTAWVIPLAAYAMGQWQVTDKLRLVPGLRADYQPNLHDGRVDPRLSAFYEFGPALTVKAGAGLYSSPPGVNAGQFLKKFGNPDLKFQDSRQFMFGLSGRIGAKTSWDVQGYYKKLTHLVVQSEAIVSRDGQLQRQNWSNGGEGYSEGVEVLIRQELTGGFFGWVSYTLSKSEWRLFEGFPYTNFPFDQRHNLVAVLSWQLPELRDVTAGVSARYTTGNWDTPIERPIYDADCDCYIPIVGKIASIRDPDFFQLDFRVDKIWVFEKWRLNAYLDVRNITNHRNIESANYNYDYTVKVPLPGLPIFPNLGLRGEW